MNEKLKAAREKRGWTMKQTASYLELEDVAYRKWERGQIPNQRNINRLCALFRMSREALGFEEEPR